VQSLISFSRVALFEQGLRLAARYFDILAPICLANCGAWKSHTKMPEEKGG
jgi:hypothetical protein